MLWRGPLYPAMSVQSRSGAERLLSAVSSVDGQGVAIDFTDGSMVVVDTSTPANVFAGDYRSKLTITGTLTPSGAGVFIDASNYATLALTALPAAIVSTACTILAEYQIATLTGTTQNVVTLDNGATTNRTQIYLTAAAAPTFETRSGGSLVANVASATYVANTLVRSASAVAANNFRGATGGTLTAADTVGAYPVSMTTLRIGHNTAGTHLGGFIRKLCIVPARLSDAAIQALTY